MTAADRARTALRVGATAVAVGGVAASVTAAAASSLAALFVRRVVTPVAERPDDVRVLSVDPPPSAPRPAPAAAGGGDGGLGTVSLAASATTREPGRYGLVQDERVVRVGQVRSDGEDVVVRALLSPPQGLVPGPARWSSWFHAGDPTSALGLAHEEVTVPSRSGPLPAWYVPAAPDDGRGDTQGGGTQDDAGRRRVWAVLVHGRGATREECLRALPLLHRLGVPSLVPMYRNDADAPSSLTGSYSLGDTEWEDVEAAVLHALAQGADDVVLLGWSMGGAIVLQHVTRSWTADRVRALVLDSPVVDWQDVLRHAARQHRLPWAVGRLGLAMLAHPSARHVVGVEAPVDLTRLDWTARAAELALPVLLLHAGDDDVVPIGPSRRLAQARPDLVTFREFPGAGHTREWNTDPDRWEREVARFLLEHL